MTVAAGARPADGDRASATHPRSGPALLPWLVAVVLLLVLRAWVVEPLVISGGSMAPTLAAGDHVLVEKLLPKRAWHRGDLLAFTAPDGTLMVKRAVGLPGDRVGLRDGVLVVNGRRMDEPYVDQEAVDSVYYGPVRVPAGHVLVMGDDRGASIDSRQFGPVSVTDVEGRVAAVLWPPDRVTGDVSGGVW
ncbi:MAG: signal peptidase I [Actinomycetes bacterium]